MDQILQKSDNYQKLFKDSVFKGVSENDIEGMDVWDSIVYSVFKESCFHLKKCFSYFNFGEKSEINLNLSLKTFKLLKFPV